MINVCVQCSLHSVVALCSAGTRLMNLPAGEKLLGGEMGRKSLGDPVVWNCNSNTTLYFHVPLKSPWHQRFSVAPLIFSEIFLPFAIGKSGNFVNACLLEYCSHLVILMQHLKIKMKQIWIRIYESKWILMKRESQTIKVDFGDGLSMMPMRCQCSRARQ